jgi:hypothetical protein
MMFDLERRRGHRIVGPLAVHVEERHFAISATTVALASLAVAAVSAGVGAYASYAQAQQQQDVAKYQAKLEQNRAQAAQQQAQSASDTLREQDRRIMAQQRAIVGGEGLSMEGSPLMILMDSAEQAQLEQQRVKYGGSLQAAGLQNQAKLLRYEGAQYARAGGVTAGTTLVTGASSALANYARYSGQSGGGIGYGAASSPYGYPNTPY